MDKHRLEYIFTDNTIFKYKPTRRTIYSAGLDLEAERFGKYILGRLNQSYIISNGLKLNVYLRSSSLISGYILTVDTDRDLLTTILEPNPRIHQTSSSDLNKCFFQLVISKRFCYNTDIKFEFPQFTLQPYQTLIIETDIKLDSMFPKEKFIRLYSCMDGLDISGIIDSDYINKNIKIIAHNRTNKDIIVCPDKDYNYSIEEYVTLGDEYKIYKERDGGFGSTDNVNYNLYKDNKYFL